MDPMDQKFRLEVDGIEVAIIMTALKSFADDHGHEEEAKPLVKVLEGVRFVRIE